MTDGDWRVETLISDSEILRDAPNLTEAARGIFEFTRFLLDDDDNLTRTGNINAEARTALRRRTLELLGATDVLPEIEEDRD